MTQEEYQSSIESIAHPRLRKLLEDDELDWDDYWHRREFMRFWLNLPREQGDKCTSETCSS